MTESPERISAHTFLADVAAEITKPHEQRTSVHEAYSPIAQAMQQFHRHACYGRPEQAYLALVEIAALAYQAAHDLRFIGDARPDRAMHLDPFEWTCAYALGVLERRRIQDGWIARDELCDRAGIDASDDAMFEAVLAALRSAGHVIEQEQRPQGEVFRLAHKEHGS